MNKLSWENSPKKNLLLCKQTLPTNVFNWVLTSLSQSGSKLSLHWLAQWSKNPIEDVNIGFISLCKHLCYCCLVSELLQNQPFLLPQIFWSPNTLAIASSTGRSFTSSLISVFSFPLHCFPFFELIYVFTALIILPWTPKTCLECLLCFNQWQARSSHHRNHRHTVSY